MSSSTSILDFATDEDDTEAYAGATINFNKGLLFVGDELEEMSSDAAKKYVEQRIGEEGFAIFFSNPKDGDSGYLGGDVTGKGEDWFWNGQSFSDVNEAQSQLKYTTLFEQFINKK